MEFGLFSNRVGKLGCGCVSKIYACIITLLWLFIVNINLDHNTCQDQITRVSMVTITEATLDTLGTNNYLQTSYINYTIMRCVGMLKFYHRAQLDKVYRI